MAISAGEENVGEEPQTPGERRQAVGKIFWRVVLFEAASSRHAQPSVKGKGPGRITVRWLRAAAGAGQGAGPLHSPTIRLPSMKFSTEAHCGRTLDREI
jgi:hypothetical protein